MSESSNCSVCDRRIGSLSFVDDRLDWSLIQWLPSPSSSTEIQNFIWIRVWSSDGMTHVIGQSYNMVHRIWLRRYESYYMINTHLWSTKLISSWSHYQFEYEFHHFWVSIQRSIILKMHQKMRWKLGCNLPKISTHFVTICNDNAINETYRCDSAWEFVKEMTFSGSNKSFHKIYSDFLFEIFESKFSTPAVLILLLWSRSLATQIGEIA